MTKLNEMIEFEGQLWTAQELFEKAFALMQRADELLIGIEQRCEARIADLKSGRELTCEEQIMLDAQLTHEAKARAASRVLDLI